MHGNIVEFSATERWRENYATAGRESRTPNAMWRKRPSRQITKVAEIQALRIAFPVEIGALPGMMIIQEKGMLDADDI